MKNKSIADVRMEIKVYEAHYKPSLNVLPSLRSILGVLLFGRTTVPPTSATMRRKR
jgi:hypothetical protein